MANISFIVKIENNLSREQLQCFFMSLIAQTGVDINIYVSTKKIDQQLVDYVKNFCKIFVLEKDIRDIIKIVDTEHICFLTPQDIIYPHFSFTLTDYLDKNHANNAVYGTSFLSVTDKDLVILSKRRYKGEVYRLRRLLLGRIHLGSVVFRTRYIQTLKIDRISAVALLLKAKPYYLERDLSEVWEVGGV